MPPAAIFIPAIMASSRFPGKPLAPINGLPMVVHCARNAEAAGYPSFVCTDSAQIVAVCEMFNIKSILTDKCVTGTDRIALASSNLDYSLIVNLQGDEPLIDPDSIRDFVAIAQHMTSDNPNSIVNGISPVSSDQAFDPNNVKCAYNEANSSILYLSRKSLLNSVQEAYPPYYKQLGLYAMTKSCLQQFSQTPPGQLEQAERIEMLRWLESGNKLMGCVLSIESISVDTPDDFLEVTKKLNHI